MVLVQRHDRKIGQNSRKQAEILTALSGFQVLVWKTDHSTTRLFEQFEYRAGAIFEFVHLDKLHNA